MTRSSADKTNKIDEIREIKEINETNEICETDEIDETRKLTNQWNRKTNEIRETWYDKMITDCPNFLYILIDSL